MIGQTKDVGWNIGVSKTLPYPVEQVWALLTSGDKTVLGFHQEWLADAEERERQREHWRAAMARVAAALS
jgi:hypothetical protein